MGAFDGLIPSVYLTCGSSKTPAKVYPYIRHQPSFNLFKDFGLDELELLVCAAEVNNEDMVWIPQERRDYGRVGLSTWYARGVVDRLRMDVPV